MCTSPNSFWEVGLQLSSTTNTWEITDATKLADIGADYPGGFSFIPSGSNKDNIFFASWDDNLVKMMKFNDTDGRPVVPTETTNFITGIERPWGFFFDPLVSASHNLRCKLLLPFFSQQTSFTFPYTDKRLFRIYLGSIY